MNVEIAVACPFNWPAKRPCHAWGAPSGHGCRLSPGHAGEHVCACGRRPSAALIAACQAVQEEA